MKVAVVLGLQPVTVPVIVWLHQQGWDVLLLEVDPEAREKVPKDIREMLPPIQFVIVPGWDDARALRRLIASVAGRKVGGIYTDHDEASPATAELREAWGFPTTPAKVIRTAIHKLRLRKTLIRLGRSKIRVVETNRLDRLARWPFPGKTALLKNAHGAGSYGVRAVCSLAEIPAALAEIDGRPCDSVSLRRYMASSRRRLLEERAEGILLSFEAVIQNGRVYPFGFTRPLRLDTELDCPEPRPMPGCVHPYRFSDIDRIADFLANTLAELGFIDGFVHIEVIVDEDGNCEIIDLNPRFIGSECLWALNAARDSPLEAVLADWAVGRLDAATIPRPTRAACLQYFLGPPGGIEIESVRFPQAPDVVWQIQLKELGERTPANPALDSWVGGYVTVGADHITALARARALRRDVLLNDHLPAIF